MAHARFNPLDKRCGINLDEIDPAKWSLLEAATDDYIAASQDRFQQLADLLIAPKQKPGRPHHLQMYCVNLYQYISVFLLCHKC